MVLIRVQTSRSKVVDAINYKLGRLWSFWNFKTHDDDDVCTV